MLPDLPVLGHGQPTETPDHPRERATRRACIEAITQATAVAKTNRALRINTTFTGQPHYDEGDLVDPHRPTETKGDLGGWNGPFPVAWNEPDRGQAIIRVGSLGVQVLHGDARHSRCIEALVAREIGSDNTALRP
eukprot:2969775-Pyramimonas_sp.AAC.1